MNEDILPPLQQLKPPENSSTKRRLSVATDNDFQLVVREGKIRDALLPGWKLGGILSEKVRKDKI